mgnify:CR=1 FL=1
MSTQLAMLLFGVVLMLAGLCTGQGHLRAAAHVWMVGSILLSAIKTSCT